MTKKRSYRLIVIFSILLVMFINTAAAIFAQTAEDIQNQITQQQSQQSNLENKLDDIEKQIEEQKNIDKQLTAEMAAILAQKQEQAGELEKMLDDLDYIYEQINQFQQTIDETEALYNEKLQLFYNRARIMYQYAQFDSLKLFTESKSIFDYATRSRLFSHMMENDRKMLQELEIMRQDLEDKKSKQELLKYDAEKLVAEKEAIIEALVKNEEVALERLEESRGLVEALEAQEEQMLAESKQISENIRALQEQYEQFTVSCDGSLMWPSRNTRKISSYFGMRLHPIYKIYKMHNGIDIGASYGTDILASADGVVTSVSYNEGGYGWYIIIYHGDGLSTLYAHCSKVIAEKGETVHQGQTIGLVGSTGAATGPHIHFEVRVNGDPVDPLNYVSP